MPDLPYAQKLQTIMGVLAPLLGAMVESPVLQVKDDPDVLDFTLGDPHELPLPGLPEALRTWSVPRSVDWFAYKTNEPAAQAVVAASLRERRGLPFEERDIFMTTGAFSALAVALKVVCDPSDEVIFNSPPWFFYESMIIDAGATPVRVRIRPDTFDLDLDAIEAAITSRTRAIIVNSPHNPTGRIYGPEALERLAAILAAASERKGRRIYLISDEAYSRLVYDGRPYHSPTAFYPSTFLIYTYGKTLLAPGARIGYIALPPSMPEREALRLPIMAAQVIHGHVFPNAVLQYALPELEPLAIDVGHLQRKRDRLVGALREMGYAVHPPEGTFYVMPRSPLPADMAFFHLLAKRKLFVLPGQVFELPGYFRMTLTASDEMIERALPRLAEAIVEVRDGAPAD